MQATQPSATSPGAVHAVRETDEIVAVCLEGEFDLANTPALVEQIEQAIQDDKHLIIDLSDATFIDSTMINALFHAANAAKAKERTIVLQLGTAPIVERVIEISEIEQVLCRVNTRADAVKMIQDGAMRRTTSRSPRWGVAMR
jgi:anti-sigma B factor antagonist